MWARQAADALHIIALVERKNTFEYPPLAKTTACAEWLSISPVIKLRTVIPFAFPSTDSSEAFGIAALEAMSCGLPVVASDLPGVRTIVRDGVTGWRCEPGSVSSFAVSLARLLGDENDLYRFGQNARKMAVEEYTNDIRAKKLNRIVSELID